MPLPDSSLATLRLSPNHGERGRAVDSLILHYTGMPTAASALELLLGPEAGVSSHYFVDEDGTILQLVPEDRRAWHAGRSSWAGEDDMNSASIGVEIVHPGHADPHPFPQAQIDAVVHLCRDICARNDIPARRVLAHSDIAVGRKIDPGEFFPWQELAERGVGHYVSPTPLAAGPTLERGASGPEVATLQDMLADYGYKIAATGRYDDDTAEVVTAFQRHFRPRLVDGRADFSTRTTLRKLIAALKVRA